MSSREASLLLRHIRTLTAGHVTSPLPDVDLLECFASRRDEAAFTALVQRHGPMVLGVCQSVLHNWHDAEDAFQATFLVLARKAGSIRQRQSVGGWLYEVAYHVAVKAQARAARRRTRARKAPDMPAADPLLDMTLRELRAALFEELNRLPEKYRTPLVLCYLEGKTQDEAAQLLGWTRGATRGRLNRGREQLRVRLARRGLAFAVVTSAALTQDASAAVPALVIPTVQAALRFTASGTAASGVAAGVVTLAENALKVLGMSKLKILASVLLTVLLAGAGAGVLAQRAGVLLPPITASRQEAPPEQGARLRDGEKAAAAEPYGIPLPADVIAHAGTVRLHHGDAVAALAFSPDGKMVASASFDGTVRLADPATGQEIRTLQGHTAGLFVVAFSPDGTRLASAGRDLTIRLWDVATGQTLQVMRDPQDWVFSLAFSADGKLLASGSGNQAKTVRLWDPATGKEVAQLTGHDGVVRTVAFSGDSKLLASADDEKRVLVWDVTTGKELHRLTGHDGGIRAVAFTPDGKTLASAGFDKSIRLWDVATGKESARLLGHDGPIHALSFSRGGILASAGSDAHGTAGDIKLWDLARGKELAAWRGHRNVALAVAFSPDGKRLASGGYDNSVRFWEAATGKELFPAAGHQAQVSCVATAPDGKTFASSSDDGTVRLWDFATGWELRRLLGHQGMVSGVAFSPDGKRLASVGREGTARLWDVATGQEVRALPTERVWFHGVVFSPDGKLVAAGSGEALDSLKPPGEVRIWETATGKATHVLSGHAMAVRAVAFSPDSRLLASASNDHTLVLWEVATGKQVRRFTEAQTAVETVAFSPDGKFLAAGSYDRQVRLWEVATGQVVQQFTAPGAYTAYQGSSVAFSCDGRTLAVGGWASIVLWEVASGKERRRLQGHRGDVRSVAFTPDSRALVTGSGDHTLLVWNLAISADLALTPGGLENAWLDLADADAAKAYRALWALAADPRQSLPLLRECLKPAPPVDVARIAQLIAKLDDDDFAIREQASADLTKLGGAAEPALREAFKSTASAEVRTRAGRLLEQLQEAALSGERLRPVRALEVLERIGTPEARQVLEGLARAAAGTPLRQEAKAVLERLGVR